MQLIKITQSDLRNRLRYIFLPFFLDLAMKYYIFFFFGWISFDSFLFWVFGFSMKMFIFPIFFPIMATRAYLMDSEVIDRLKCINLIEEEGEVIKVRSR